MCRGGKLRDISEVSEVGVNTIQQFRHLGPFTHSPSSQLTMFRRMHIVPSTETASALINFSGEGGGL